MTFHRSPRSEDSSRGSYDTRGSRTGRPHRDDQPVRRRSGNDEQLIRALDALDGRPYGAYKSVIGDWDYGDFSLAVDRVQADPYAPPSGVRAISTPQRMGLPEAATASRDARIATADYLARAFARAIRERGAQPLAIARTGQEILQRSSCTVMPDRVEVRFQVEMPARGRTIMGRRAAEIFDVDIPDVVMDTLDFRTDSEQAQRAREELAHHIAVYEDYCALQAELAERGWVAFVANGSVLARRSGISQHPLDDALPFASPDTLRATVTLPHAGEVAGMAIEPGVTVIAGGGYHGKSTLLGALQRGVYAHIPGDGRELVATTPDAMKVRAADGRAVTGVDVSAFISHLPGGADTSRFSTDNASGSTSQAASIMEAVELGCPLLLIDEDTSATNLLIRDTRMRALVAADKEPITPLVDRVRALFTERGTSTILVMGGSGDYLDVADRVLMLDSYRCVDATARAREVVASMPRERGDLPGIGEAQPRCPVKVPRADRPKTKAQGLDSFLLDRQNVDVSDIEQIVDPGQTEMIAWLVRGLLEQAAGASAVELLKRLERTMNSEGLDAVVKFGAREFPAFLVRPRLVDVGAALNRYRGLRLTSGT